MFELQQTEQGGPATSNASLLWTLGPRYAPLGDGVCAWLADREVAVNASWCSADNATTLPVDVCAALANLSAPLAGTRCLPRAPTLDRDDVIRATMLAVLAIVSTVGNCVTIHSIRNKASHAPVYKLLMHLSVADVLVALVCIAGEAVWMLLVQWPFGTAACKAFKFLQMTALHGSSYVVVLIAQNRWVAVSHPLASRRHGSSTCGHVRDTLRCASPRSVLLVWVVGAALSTPQLLMFSVKEGPFYEPYYQCVTYDVSTESERLYNIINFITMFVIPLLGLVASYLSIYCTLSRGQREIRSVDKMTIATYDQNRQRSMKRAMVKSRWIAVVIVCAYLVSWLPYYITMLVYFLSPDQEQWYDSKWMDWIFFFGMGNSVVNPAIYGMFQLWKPKRRRQWSCFRHKDGSTQVSQFMTQDSFRRHGAAACSLVPPRTPACASEGCASPTASCAPSAPASPVPAVPLHAIPDVRRAARPAPDCAETALIATTATLPRVVVTSDLVVEVPVVVRTPGKAGPFGWRAKFLRKYRALRAHSAHQAHI